MIDFRYHLVSLVAVFIALAVGIALGAGPLRDGISSTLESEVDQLRQERIVLRAEVDNANRRADAKDEAIGVIGEKALGGTLQDLRVGLIVFPGADRNTLDGLEGRLSAAGADVVLQAELNDKWDDPEPSQERLQLFDQLGQRLADPEPTSGGSPTAATILAAVLSGSDAEGHVGAWLAAGGALEDAGLVDLTWRDGTPASVTDRRAPEALILVSDGLTVSEATATNGIATLASRMGLVGALSKVSTPLVITGTGGEAVVADLAARVDPLVRAVREDKSLVQRVSTIDNLESSAGQIAAAFALAWQVQGDAGHFGLGELAQAPFPPLPPLRAIGGPLPESGPAPTPEPPADEKTGQGEGDAAFTTSP